MTEEDKKPQEKEETSKEIVKDIEKSGVPEKIAEKEEKLDKKIIKNVEKTAEKKEEKEWKEFVVPLRRKFGKVARYRRTPRAIKAIKEFLVRHMKMYERDLKKVKLDKYLNEFIWTRGIRNPPSRVKIRAVIDGDVIRAELAELTEALRFKKEKLARRETRAPKVHKTPEAEKAPEKTEEEKAEEKEKKAAVVEAGQKMEKLAEKQAKHQTKISKQPKRQRRMALQK